MVTRALPNWNASSRICKTSAVTLTVQNAYHMVSPNGQLHMPS